MPHDDHFTFQYTLGYGPNGVVNSRLAALTDKTCCVLLASTTTSTWWHPTHTPRAALFLVGSKITHTCASPSTGELYTP
jgi:hypothetical protein